MTATLPAPGGQPKLKVVGQPIPRVEGRQKVTGAATYAADVTRPGTLVVGTLRSPVAHALIRGVDTTRAMRVPGVRAIVTGKDVSPGLMGYTIKDMPVIARDHVRFVGERVAAVAAESIEAAEEALLLIDVDYEELPSVFDAFEALEPDAPLLHPDYASYERPHATTDPSVRNLQSITRYAMGDVDEAFARAARVFEHRFSTQMVHQGYLEPRSCTVEVDDGGQVRIWDCDQAPYRLRSNLSQIVGIPEDDIVIFPVNIGGSFGSKADVWDAVLLYELARRTGRPVKVVWSYTEELLASNPRHPATIILKTGVDGEGKLLARQGRVVFNGGAYACIKPNPEGNLTGGLQLGGSYFIPNTRLESWCVYTNQVPCGYMRAPGEAQVHFAVESHMDMMADALRLDPLEFRLRNAIRSDQLTPNGLTLRDVRCGEVLETAAAASAWAEYQKTPRPPHSLAYPARGSEGLHSPPEEKNIPLPREGARGWGSPDAAPVDADDRALAEPGGLGGWHSPPEEKNIPLLGEGARGWGSPPLGMICRGRGVSLGDRHTGTAIATVELQLRPEGELRLVTVLLDVGPGPHTMMTQVAAEVLGIDADQITIEMADTSRFPYDMGVKGASGTYGSGQAVFGAAHKLIERLKTLAAEEWGVSVEELEWDSGGLQRRGVPSSRMDLRALARLSPEPVCVVNRFDPPGKPHQLSFQAQVADVAVDPETGQVTLEHLLTVHDVGTIINPITHQGQIEGAVLQGFGYAVMEDMDPVDGKPTALSLGEYKLPNIRDIPPLQTEHVFATEGPAPFDSKAIAESGISILPAAIANAVFDAVGVRITSLPITPEKVRAALAAAKREERP